MAFSAGYCSSQSLTIHMLKTTLASSWTHTQALTWMLRPFWCVSVPPAHPHPKSPYIKFHPPSLEPPPQTQVHTSKPIPQPSLPCSPSPSSDEILCVPPKPHLRICVQFLLGVKPHQIHSQCWRWQVFPRTALGWLVMVSTSFICTLVSIRCVLFCTRTLPWKESCPQRTYIWAVGGGHE